jgi:trk system potassium uptake protein
LKIVIIGAGDVGFELSKVLSEEKHDVIVLDQSQELLKRVTDKLDVLTVEGNATSPNDLIRAQVKDSDILIAVTNIDEVNIVTSMMGKRLGARYVIARVRNDELSRKDSPLTPSELGIDVLIHPELAAAREIVQLIKRASASDIVSLADGKLQLIGLRLEKTSELIGPTLAEIAQSYDQLHFRIVAISRRTTTIIPAGNNRLMAGDQLFILSKTDEIKTLIEATGHTDERFDKIMIAGGTEVGEIISRELCNDSHKWQIKLIEPDLERAEQLAEEFRNVLVLHGNPTDPNLLVVEGIHEMDAFVSVTNDEESNIISCLMAKHLEVKKTVALVSKPEYAPLSQTIGLDAAVNVKASASDEIHRHVRKGELITVKALKGIKAEIFEVVASNECKVIGKPVRELHLPDGAVLGGILSNGHAEIAIGNSIIKEGDRVIVFALPRAIDKVVKLFQ